MVTGLGFFCSCKWRLVITDKGKHVLQSFNKINILKLWRKPEEKSKKKSILLEKHIHIGAKTSYIFKTNKHLDVEIKIFFLLWGLSVCEFMSVSLIASPCMYIHTVSPAIPLESVANAYQTLWQQESPLKYVPSSSLSRSLCVSVTVCVDLCYLFHKSSKGLYGIWQ